MSWAADITYIWTRERWLYLAVILDLFFRKIIGWSMKDRLEKRLVMDALLMALGHRKTVEGVLHHADRGSQYASKEYQALLKRAGINCSMSRKGQLLGQCRCGEFLLDFKKGVGARQGVSDKIGSQSRYLLFH